MWMLNWAVGLLRRLSSVCLSVSVHRVQKPDTNPGPGRSGIRLLPGPRCVFSLWYIPFLKWNHLEKHGPLQRADEVWLPLVCYLRNNPLLLSIFISHLFSLLCFINTFHHFILCTEQTGARRQSSTFTCSGFFTWKSRLRSAFLIQHILQKNTKTLSPRCCSSVLVSVLACCVSEWQNIIWMQTFHHFCSSVGGFRTFWHVAGPSCLHPLSSLGKRIWDQCDQRSMMWTWSHKLWFYFILHI